MKPREKSNTLRILGAVYICYWLTDFYFNAILPRDFSWILWYSSAGFLITGIALILQNTKLTYSLFCALFVVESAWIIDFISVLFGSRTIIGLTSYMFSSTFSIRDFYLTLYHALIPIGLFAAVRSSKETYKYGWVGASIYAFAIAMLTYFLLGPTNQVNCIHATNQCETIFSFLYGFNSLQRALVAVLGLIVFVFIPTNYVLLHFKSSVSTQVSPEYSLHKSHPRSV